MLVHQRVSPKVWPYLCPKWAMNIGWDKSMAETWPSWSAGPPFHGSTGCTPLVHRFQALEASRFPGLCPQLNLEGPRVHDNDNENKKSTSTQANKDRKKEEKKTSSTTAFNFLRKKHHPHHHNSKPRDKFQSRHHEKIHRPRGQHQNGTSIAPRALRKHHHWALPAWPWDDHNWDDHPWPQFPLACMRSLKDLRQALPWRS